MCGITVMFEEADDSELYAFDIPDFEFGFWRFDNEEDTDDELYSLKFVFQGDKDNLEEFRSYIVNVFEDFRNTKKIVRYEIKI
jgi:hypothetical protein